MKKKFLDEIKYEAVVADFKQTFEIYSRIHLNSYRSILKVFEELRQLVMF